MYLRLSILLLLTLVAETAIAALPSFPMESVNAEAPVQLQSLYIHGDIGGSMAETTVRMVFFNPNPRALEGRLQFQLEARQQVTAFALEVDGAMRPVVSMEKAQGRQIAEYIGDCKLNAGILEQTTDNNFTLRVCPIPAMRTRTIELKYTETMVRDGKSWAYHLPLAYDGVVRDFNLSFTIRGSGDVPSVSGMFGFPRLDRDVRGYFFHVEEHNFAPDGVLDISIPTAQHALTYVQEYEGETYFVAEIPAAALHNPRSQVRSIDADGATAIVMDVTDVEQGLVRVAGKLRNVDAKLHMRIIEQGERKDMSIAVSVRDPRHPMVARLWAAYQPHALLKER